MMIENPNWIAVTGAVLTLTGAGFLTKAVLGRQLMASGGAGAERRERRWQLETGIGAPLLVSGLFVSLLGQFATAALTAPIAWGLLFFAFGLLVYGLVETWIVDGGLQSVDTQSTRRVQRPALVPASAAPIMVADATLIPAELAASGNVIPIAKG